MPPHGRGGALGSPEGAGTAELLDAGVELVLGAAVALGIAAALGSCGGGVAGVQPTSSQYENETHVIEVSPERMTSLVARIDDVESRRLSSAVGRCGRELRRERGNLSRSAC